MYSIRTHLNLHPLPGPMLCHKERLFEGVGSMVLSLAVGASGEADERHAHVACGQPGGE